jgi:hypothetical protein
MRCASYDFEAPNGIEFLQSSSPVPTTSPLPARAPMPSGDTPQRLAAKLQTSSSTLEGQRKQVTADPDVMEERG